MTTSIFPTAEEIRGIAGPIVADAAVQLGSKADLYELTEVLNEKDATTKRVPNLLVANDLSIRLKDLTSEEVQEIFGLNENVTMKGSMSRVAPVAFENVFVVISGDFAGRKLLVKSVIEKPLSDSYVIGLVDYEGTI